MMQLQSWLELDQTITRAVVFRLRVWEATHRPDVAALDRMSDDGCPNFEED